MNSLKCSALRTILTWLKVCWTQRHLSYHRIRNQTFLMVCLIAILNRSENKLWQFNKNNSRCKWWNRNFPNRKLSMRWSKMILIFKLRKPLSICQRWSIKFTRRAKRIQTADEVAQLQTGLLQRRHRQAYPIKHQCLFRTRVGWAARLANWALCRWSSSLWMSMLGRRKQGSSELDSQI